MLALYSLEAVLHFHLRNRPIGLLTYYATVLFTIAQVSPDGATALLNLVLKLFIAILSIYWP